MFAQNLEQEKIEYFNLANTYQTYPASFCSYCSEQAQREFRFTSKPLSPVSSQKLSGKGWARYQYDYFKPYLEETCCKQWSIRLNVNQFMIKKEQRKTMEKTLKYFSPHQSQQQKNGKKISKNSKKLKQQQKINEEIQTKLQQILFQIQQKCVLNNFTTLIKNISIKIELQIEIPEIKSILKEVKYFQSKNKKKGDYFCNYFMLIYGQIKKNLPKKTHFSVQSFIEQVKKIIKFDDFAFFIEIQNSGYLVFRKQKKMIKQKQQKIKQIHKNMEQNTKQIYEKDEKDEKDEQIDFYISDETIICGKLKIIFTKPNYTKQKFQLWNKYRTQIHNKPNNNQSSFQSFICCKGLRYQDQDSIEGVQKYYNACFGNHKQKIEKKVRKRMGCYHMNYYLEDKLIGLSAVNILPCSFESIYFMYDPSLKLQKKLRMGVFSAIVDIQYMRWMSLSFPEFKYYNMCYYIQNCTKMKYKADYEPFQILCPVTYKWVVFSPEVRSKIDQIDNKETQNLQLADSHVQKDQDMQIPEDIEIYAVENLKFKIQQEFFMMNQDKIMEILKNLMSNIGKSLSKQFTFIVE